MPNNVQNLFAREHVRVARALGELPIVDAHFARGELSYSKVRAITRVATPETEQAFVDIAMHATASQIARLFRSYARCLEDPQAPRGQRRHVHRSETIDGMVRIEIVLPPEEATVVWEAMEAAMDTARRTTDAPAEASGPECEANPAPAEAPERAPMPSVAQLRADAVVDLARAYLQHRPRTLGAAYELVVITTQEQLNAGQNGVGGFLRDGTPIPLYVARMLANNGSRVDVVLGEHGELLDVGRRTRAIPAAIARGLWLRDGGCRVPGCGRTRHLHAHHIQGWADGRAMDLQHSLSWMLMGPDPRLRGGPARN